MVQQVSAATRRVVAPRDPGPDAGLCVDCGPVPQWYLKTRTRCRACVSARSHAARVENTYQLPPGGYAILLAAQGGRCAICRERPRASRLCVDHNHATGAVRGLLCDRCNHLLLGGGKDSLAILERAVAYMRGGGLVDTNVPERQNEP